MNGPDYREERDQIEEEAEEDLHNLENIEGDWINMCQVNTKPVD